MWVLLWSQEKARGSRRAQFAPLACRGHGLPQWQATGTDAVVPRTVRRSEHQPNSAPRAANPAAVRRQGRHARGGLKQWTHPAPCRQGYGNTACLGGQAREQSKNAAARSRSARRRLTDGVQSAGATSGIGASSQDCANPAFRVGFGRFGSPEARKARGVGTRRSMSEAGALRNRMTCFEFVCVGRQWRRSP